MATAMRVPVEVYLRSSYEPGAEYVDGEIEERPAGENEHSAWQQAICFWFHQHAREWSVRIRPALRIQAGLTRFRVPDVTVLDRAQPAEQIITHPPLAVFEILSPEDRVRRLLRKLEDYTVMGIPEIWVSDPQNATYYRYKEHKLMRSDSFNYDARGIVFPMDQIKNHLDL
jgi:Uma2 family endonuclease